MSISACGNQGILRPVMPSLKTVLTSILVRSRPTSASLSTKLMTPSRERRGSAQLIPHPLDQIGDRPEVALDDLLGLLDLRLVVLAHGIVGIVAVGGVHRGRDIALEKIDAGRDRADLLAIVEGDGGLLERAA